MDSHYTYAAILAGSLSIPLIASFLKPLVFSKKLEGIRSINLACRWVVYRMGHIVYPMGSVGI